MARQIKFEVSEEGDQRHSVKEGDQNEMGTRLVGRSYSIPHKNKTVCLYRKYVGDDNWASVYSFIGQFTTTEKLASYGWDFEKIELIPLSIEEQWTEIFAINPTEIILKPTFIVIKYGDGFELHHTCRTIAEGVCKMADELYYKRLNPDWINQTPSSLIGLVPPDQLRGGQT